MQGRKKSAFPPGMKQRDMESLNIRRRFQPVIGAQEAALYRIASGSAGKAPKEIQKWSPIMSAVILKGKREDLFREISNVLQKWPDRERRIFARAHYQGQSPESISHSLELDVNEVSSILKKCDRELLDSLRGFREGTRPEASFIPTASASSAA
jgi:DNA-directed RNA polymerase specialized sigma24 family protein